MKEKTQIKILISVILILSFIFLFIFIKSIKTIKKQNNEIDMLKDEIILKEIEIDSQKETIYRYEIEE